MKRVDNLARCIRDDGPFHDRGAVLIVDDDPATRSSLEAILRNDYRSVHTAKNAADSLCLAKIIRFSILITNINLPGSVSGPDLVRQIRNNYHGYTDVVFLSSESNLNTALSSLQDIEADFIRKPFHTAELLTVLRRAQERRRIERENFLLQRVTDQRPIGERVVGESDPIKEFWRIINRVAPVAATVLIKGETGTGKELAARALHDLSGRKGSYVPVNCAAISADLIESELFGHAKGAFTGAVHTRQGLFAHADGGTLFLDEIGEMPLAMQAKLLRVLEQKSCRPIGGNQEVATTARVVTATNRDLAAEVVAGRFRKDLYYRINVLTLRIPPLRERKSDIERLTRLYLHILAVELGVATPVLDPWDLEAMVRYDWPGNIRELRNVIERSLLLGKPLSQMLATTEPPRPAEQEAGQSIGSLKKREESEILKALAEVRGNKTAAARILGVSRKTIDRKLKRMNAPNPDRPASD